MLAIDLLKSTSEFFDVSNEDFAPRIVVPAFPHEPSPVCRAAERWWAEELPQFPIPEKLHPGTNSLTALIG